MPILGGFPRAPVDVNSPDAWGICDRCGFTWLLKELKFQYAYRGNNLVSTGYLVCEPCYDRPFELNRPLILPPDPEPVPNARPPQWAAQMAGNSPAEGPIQQPILEDTDGS